MFESDDDRKHKHARGGAGAADVRGCCLVTHRLACIVTGCLDPCPRGEDAEGGHRSPTFRPHLQGTKNSQGSVQLLDPGF